MAQVYLSALVWPLVGLCLLAGAYALMLLSAALASAWDRCRRKPQRSTQQSITTN
ncbi:MAG: hypothetical protein ACK47M_08410 [Caldilinea sp.]